MSESYDTSCVIHLVSIIQVIRPDCRKAQKLAHGCRVSEGRTCLKSKPRLFLVHRSCNLARKFNNLSIMSEKNSCIFLALLGMSFCQFRL